MAAENGESQRMHFYLQLTRDSFSVSPVAKSSFKANQAAYMQNLLSTTHAKACRAREQSPRMLESRQNSLGERLSILSCPHLDTIGDSRVYGQ
jgi:hypothetical protein